MMKKFALLASLSLWLLITSCSTPKNITYFQDVQSGAEITPAQQLDIRVKPGDKLSILVTTQDPALSTLFNLVQMQNRLGTTTTATSSTRSATNSQQGYIAYYTVSPQGDINFPVIGKIHIEGMQRAEVASFIETELQKRDLVKDPVVTVEFANTGLSIIGEVARPGRYEFNQDRINILDALAMAGDLTTLGMRENVTVMREDGNGKTHAYHIDLTDLNGIAQSPVYYLQQNDVIYVEPNDKKKRETTSSGNSIYTPSFWVSISSLTVTIATFIVTTTK